MPVAQAPLIPYSLTQRHCHIVLMLYLPDLMITPTTLQLINASSQTLLQQDLRQLRIQLKQSYKLKLRSHNGRLRLNGSALNRHLCLQHWLQKGLRFCPAFIKNIFSYGLSLALAKQEIPSMLRDEAFIRALIIRYSKHLSPPLIENNIAFLVTYLRFCLLQNDRPSLRTFSAHLRQWLMSQQEHRLALRIVRHWRRYEFRPVNGCEALLLTAILSGLRAADARCSDTAYNRPLHNAIHAVITRFEQGSQWNFQLSAPLHKRLIMHLTQVLYRRQFSIGLPSEQTGEIRERYPRLVSLTSDALAPFAAEHHITLPEYEVELVALIFGAWLLYEGAVERKQIVLLTTHFGQTNSMIEQQLVTQTLQPVTLRSLPLSLWQCFSMAPDMAEADLILTLCQAQRCVCPKRSLHLSLPLTPVSINTIVTHLGR